MCMAEAEAVRFPGIRSCQRERRGSWGGRKRDILRARKAWKKPGPGRLAALAGGHSGRVRDGPHERAAGGGCGAIGRCSGDSRGFVGRQTLARASRFSNGRKRRRPSDDRRRRWRNHRAGHPGPAGKVGARSRTKTRKPAGAHCQAVPGRGWGEKYREPDPNSQKLDRARPERRRPDPARGRAGLSPWHWRTGRSGNAAQSPGDQSGDGHGQVHRRSRKWVAQIMPRRLRFLQRPKNDRSCRTI